MPGKVTPTTAIYSDIGPNLSTLHLAITAPHPVRRLFFLCTFMFALCANPVFANTSLVDPEASEATYQSLNIDSILVQATQGDVLAQHELGNRFARGSGVPRSSSAAARWFSYAASRGTPGSPPLDGLSNFPLRADRTNLSTDRATRESLPTPPVATVTVSIEQTGGLNVGLDGTSSEISGAIFKQLWFVQDNAGAILDLDIAESLSTQITLPESGEFYATLILIDTTGQLDYHTALISAEGTIEPPIIPQVPVIILPTAQSTVVSSAPTEFSWTSVDAASGYELEISNIPLDASGDFEQSSSRVILFPAVNCIDVSCSIQTAFDTPGGASYAWRVRAVNELNFSAWATSSVYVVDEATSRPALATPLFPASGTDLIIGATATFRWALDPLATTYSFHFFNNAPPNRGELPHITGLRPQDICTGQVCEFQAEVNLVEFTNHAWRVRAENRVGNLGWSRTTFNAVTLVTEAPPTPVQISPAAGSLLEATSNVVFSWQPADNATRYDFELFNSSLETNQSVVASVPVSNCSDTLCSFATDIPSDLGVNFQWQVRASNAVGISEWASSPVEIINLATQPPPIPVAISPEPEVQLESGRTYEFSWMRDEHAVTYEFHFFDNELKDTAPFVTGLRPDTVCNDTTCSISQVVALPIAQGHAWRVRGRNSLGASFWSRSVFDTIEQITEAPGAFALLSPADGADIEEGLAVTFLWSRALRATSFELAIIDGSLNDASVTPITVLASTCDEANCRYSTVLDLPLNIAHQWQVRAINPIGTTEWADSSFTIVEEVIEPPLTPIAVAPTSDVTLINGQSVSFQWQGRNDVDTYDFYINDAFNGALAIVPDLDPAVYCEANVCTHVATIDLAASNLHTWHVRAKRNDGSASEWSQTAMTIVEGSGTGEPNAAFLIAGFREEAIGLAPLSLSFDPSASTDDLGIVSFIWNFGDGSPELSVTSNDTVQHTYTNPGTYSATLTVVDAADLADTTSQTVTVLDSNNTVSAVEASRLLTQASFGPSRNSILDVQALGIENWIDQQFALQGPAHLPYVRQFSNGSNRAPRHEVWWSDVVLGEDQLRQRVAFALSQLFVISDTGFTLSNAQYGITNYYDMLREQAFGNYRDLLESVTLSPVMGLYLSMLQNAKTDVELNTRADENFAREVLQLFSIGLYELNSDGTSTGNSSFTQDNIEAFARAFTGWNYADAGRWDRKPFTNADVINPMRPFESFHDIDAKTLLNGQTSPAGQSARQDLDFALDNIFNHPNVGPFVAKQLIKRLVTSNPTPAYVERVASAFNDDGTGVRGNLQAVIRVLLLDSEARSAPANIDNTNTFGKLREPVLRLSHLWRAFSVQPGSLSVRGEFNTPSPAMENLDSVTGQAVLKSPSVFNFYQPSFSPAGVIADQNLVAPEFELFTESNELATSNRIGEQIQLSYLNNPDSRGRRASHLDFTFEISIGNDVDALLDHLDLLLTSGNLRAGTRSTLFNYLSDLPDTTEGISQRVRDAVTLLMASPDYLIQR